MRNTEIKQRIGEEIAKPTLSSRNTTNIKGLTVNSLSSSN